jgi:putative PIN family toxin of toxin-antitoxin system
MQILQAARAGQVQLLTSAGLLLELEDVLGRSKFSERLLAARLSAQDLVLGYASLTTLITPATIRPVILRDPDDDVVLACALGGNAEFIVSTDSHLLELERYASIAIVTPATLMAQLA